MEEEKNYLLQKCHKLELEKNSLKEATEKETTDLEEIQIKQKEAHKTLEELKQKEAVDPR